MISPLPCHFLKKKHLPRTGWSNQTWFTICYWTKKAIFSGDPFSFLECTHKFIWLHDFLFKYVCRDVSYTKKSLVNSFCCGDIKNGKSEPKKKQLINHPRRTPILFLLSFKKKGRTTCKKKGRTPLTHHHVWWRMMTYSDTFWRTFLQKLSPEKSVDYLGQILLLRTAKLFPWHTDATATFVWRFGKVMSRDGTICETVLSTDFSGDYFFKSVPLFLGGL